MRLTRTLVLLLLWSFSFTVVATQPDRLFDPGTTPDQTQLPAHALVAQSRFVKINRGLLGHESFVLELFDGDYLAIRDRLERKKGGSFVWVGHIEGEQGSQVVFAFHRNHVSGFINKGDETIELGSNRNGKLILYRVDESALPEVEPSTIPDAAYGVSGNESDFEPFNGALENAIHQELLLVYTQSACDQRGSCDSLEADLLASIADSNQAYVNSGVGIELNIAGMELVNYDEGGIAQSLKHLTWSQGHADDPEGALDEVHNWRDQTSADFVVLVSDDTDYCGIGWVNSTPDTAFSVVKWSCLSNRSLSHEIGHNQGNAHNRENASVAGRFSFSYGHRECDSSNGFRTVMSYSSGCDVPRVNHFSNPDIKYKGQDTGISEIDSPASAANNALSLNTTAAVVASFRQDPNSPFGVFNPSYQQNFIEDTVALQIEIINSNNQPVTFSANGLPEGLAIDPSSGLVTGTLNIDTVGYFSVEIYASIEIQTAGIRFNWRVTDLDGNGGESSSPPSDECLDTDGDNNTNSSPAIAQDPCESPSAPVIINPGTQTSLVGDTVSLWVGVLDTIGDTFTISATGLPTSLSINAFTGLISGTVNDAEGLYLVTLTAIDSTLLQDQESFLWQVNSASNSPAITDPGQQSNQVGDAVSLQVVATDPNGDTLSYSASGLPASLSINSLTGLISGTANDVPGSYPVTLTVVDSTSLQTQLSFNWEVLPAPIAPAISDPGQQTNLQGDAVSLQIVASDANGDTLTYSASGLPGGLAIDSVTGLISGTVSDVLGTYVITLTVVDSTALQDQLSFNWEVLAGAVAPVITDPGQQTNIKNETVTLQVIASDVNGDTLTYSASGLPNDLLIDSVTGLISGKIKANQVGTHQVTLTVLDGTGLQDQLSFTWQVNATANASAPVITNPGQQTNLVGDSVSLLILASDADGDTLTYSASGLPASLSINSATGLISGTVIDVLGTYSVTLTVVDSTSLQSQLGFNWEVVTSPVAPVITDPGQQTNQLGDAVSLQVVASDGNGDTLTYSASGLPASLSINSVTGLISGSVNDTLGNHLVTLTVVDSTSLQSQVSFNWEVLSVPVAPVITNPGTQINLFGESVSLQIVASDGNGDTLTYSASGLPSGLSINSTTGLISGTVSDSVGTYAVTLTVVDSTSLQSQVIFNWDVVLAPVAPVITNPGSQTNLQGDVISLQVVASDGNGDTLTYSASGLPASLSMNTTTGLISGTLTDALGEYLVTVTVVDSTSLQSQVNFNWEVLSAPVAPVITDPGSQSNLVDDVVSLQVVASDANGDTLTYSASGLPPGLSINSTTGLISGTVSDGQGVVHVVTLTVVDDTALQSQLNFNWEILSAPVAPVITDPGGQTNLQGDAVSLQVVASDGNGDTLTYSASGLPAGLSIHSVTGLISGTVSDAPNEYFVTLTVADTTALQSQLSFNWEILSGPAAPVITDPGPQSNLVDDVVSLQVVASDVNGDTLTYSASGLPPSLSINSTTGLISGTVSDGQGVVHVVTLTVVDATALQSQLNFNWEILSAPVAPVITDPGEQNNARWDAVSLQVDASDDNGDTLTYTASGLPGGLSIDSVTGLISGTISSIGIFAVTLTVVDSTFLQSQLIFNWAVFGEASPPVIVDPGPQYNLVDDVVSLQVVASDSDGDVLTYFASSLPSGLSINPTTGLISGTITEAMSGYVTLTVVDATMTQSELSFYWEVLYAPAAPVITDPGPQSNLIDDVVSLQILASEVNGDTLTYSASGLPTGLSINPTTGLISGTVSGAVATYVVTLTVVDSTSLQSQLNFNWLVNIDPVAPVITDPGQQTSLLGDFVSLQIAASDENEDTLTYAASGLPAGLSIDPDTGWISGTVNAALGSATVTLTVTDTTALQTQLSIDWDIFDLSAVTDLSHIWNDEPNRLFKLAWRYPQEAMADNYRTPEYFKVSPAAAQTPETMMPLDVTLDANIGNRMWQSFELDGFYYLGSTFMVEACVGDNHCGPLVAVNLQTAAAGSDLEAVGQLEYNWIDEVAGTFVLNWSYDTDYFSSSLGKPDNFQIVPSLDPSALPIIVTAGNPPLLEWQSLTIDDDDTIGSSYLVMACKNTDDCGPAMIISLSRQPTEPDFPTPVWEHADLLADSNLQFTLDWQPTTDDRIDYFTIEETGPHGTPLLYTEDDSIAIEHGSVGEYSYRIKACNRDREYGDVCGVFSSTVNVTVDDDKQMEMVNNLNWFWVSSQENTIRLSWEYPANSFNTEIGRPDYFWVRYFGGMHGNVDFNEPRIEATYNANYTWVSEIKDLDATFSFTNFEVRACTNSGICSELVDVNPWTDDPGPVVTPDENIPTNSWDNPVPEPDTLPGGPDDLKPGSWWDPARAGTGWDFFWASELRYPSLHENFGETYDLIAFWYAYQQFPDVNGDKIWLPVWFYSLLKLEQDEIHYSGTLYFPNHTTGGENCYAADSCAVGNIEVFIDPATNTEATVGLMIDKSAGLEGIIVAGNSTIDLSYIGDDPAIFGSNSNSLENPHDHFSGMWGPSGALQDEFATLHWMEGWFESLTVVHYDQNGVPIWTRAQLDGRPKSHRDGSPAMNGNKPLDAVNRIHDETIEFPGPIEIDYEVYTVGLGFNPTEPKPAGYKVSENTVSEDPDNPDPDIRFRGGRLFEDHDTQGDDYEGHRKAGVWLDLKYSIGSGAGTRNVDLLVGTANTPVEMRKLTNFHDIRFYVGENQTETSECPLSEGSGTCDLRINWFTDSEYPELTAFLHNTDSGQYTEIDSASQVASLYPTTIDYPYSISELGNYQLELWKYPDMSGGVPDLDDKQGNAQIAVSGNLEVTAAVVVPPGTPEIPPGPDTGPDTSQIDSSSQIGATAGQFRVDESGNANYSIPIMTAAGSGGVAPQISLNYSSQSGNGPLGVGWSLGGLSAITRCAQTIEQDAIEQPDGSYINPEIRNVTLTQSDRFCLDGQRLVLVSGVYGDDGAEYRTEIDSIARIRSIGDEGSGPISFEVERKDGSISFYGDSTESRIEARSSEHPDTALVWAQNRFEDSAGNYINFEYLENSSGPVEFVIERIVYTGNDTAGISPFAELLFNYSNTRADTTRSYVAGAEIAQTQLLTSILSKSSVLEGDPLTDLRFYELHYDTDGYGRKILEDFDECNRSIDPTCYASTTFTWLKSLHEFEASRTNISNPTVLPQSETIYGMQLADVNGDARPEVLYTTLKDADGEFYFKIESPQADGQFSSMDSIPSYLLPKKNSSPSRLFAIDLNADGFQDVIYRKYDPDNFTWSWKRRLSTGSSFSSETEVSLSAWDFVLDETDPKTSTRISVVDFNGDGLSDLLNNKTERISDDNELFFELALNTGDPDGYLSGPVEYSVDFDDPVTGNSLIPKDLPGWDVYNDDVYIARTPEGELLKNKVFDYDGDGGVDLLRLVWRQFRDCTANCDPPLDPLPGETVEAPTYQYTMASFWVIISPTDTNVLDYQVVAKGMGCITLNTCLEEQHLDLPMTDNMVPVDINADGLADLAYSNGHKSGTNQWYYMLNTGNGFTMEINLTGTTTETALPAYADEHVRFEDMNGDGYPDLVYPSDMNTQAATWEILYNEFGNGFSTAMPSTLKAGEVGQNIITGESDENDATIFADFTGNGKLDHLFLNFDDQGKIIPSNTDSGLYKGRNFVTGNTGTEPSNVITEITNGLGAKTTLSYLPLTDSSVYTRALDAPQATDWGKKSIVYDLIAPIYVVSQATSSAPAYDVSTTTFDPNATSNVQYHYVGAKMQGGGRGYLGFGEVISYDPQSEIRTNTRYRQDYPFIGMPVDTMQSTASATTKFLTLSATTNNNLPIWSSVDASTVGLPSLDSNNKLISYAINEWKTISTAGDALLPYLANSLERSYSLTGDFDRKVFTSSIYDSYGNLTSSTVATYDTDESLFASQSTINTYADVIDSTTWFLGRLENSRVTHSRPGMDDIERESSFGYDIDTGILDLEIIEPNESTYRVTTSYVLDDFGNRKETTVQANGVLRTAKVQYDDLGRFTVQSENALDQITQTINSWDVYGNPLVIANIDGVLTTNTTDHMGRPFTSYTETGVWSKSINTAGSGSYCPSGTVFHTTTTAGGAPTQIQCFDVLGRAMRSAVQTLSGSYSYTDQSYDSSGRVARVSEPYFEGDTVHWNETGYDPLGRIEWVDSAAGDHLVRDYDGEATNICGVTPVPRVTVSINGRGQERVEVKNVMGETVAVYDHEDNAGNCGMVSYQYDAIGNLTDVTGADGVVVSMSYDLAGRKVDMIDPDKGIWQYAYNALGEMTRQLDSKGQAIDFVYDDLGRVTARYERKDVTSLTDSSTTLINSEISSYLTTSPGMGQPDSVNYKDEFGFDLHIKTFSYDGFGRVDIVSTTIVDEGTFAEQTTYDEYSRVFQQFDASDVDNGLRYVYSNGHLSQLKEARDGVAGTIYQDIVAMDARGNVTNMTLGGPVSGGYTAIIDATYDQSSGRLTNLAAYDGFGLEIQNVEYFFDVLGNLKKRHDQSGLTTNLKETFEYDELNRLEEVFLSIDGAADLNTMSLSYDAAGNIKSKSGVGTYLYGASQPHAVSGIEGSPVIYAYDSNGNQISGDDRIITYTVFDKPDRITKLGDQVDFAYGVGNSRYKRIDTGTVERTTLYLGSVESITDGSGTYYKRYLGGVAIATYYPSNGNQSIEYLLKDHIGSIHTVLNESGAITARMHFGAFGERQDMNWQTPFTGDLDFLNDITTRGFTGHEQVDSMGIVHMNGRIYDPKLGRFLQADPIVQAPKNSQSLNRYTYVFNNPLSYTDPSGYYGIEGFIVASVISSFINFIAHEINTAPGNETGQKKSFDTLVPGTVAGAFGNGQQRSINDCVQGTALCGGANSQRSAESYLEQTASNTMGATYSEISGGKFANGAATITHEVTTGYIDHGSSGTSMAVSAAEVLVPGYDLYRCTQSRECTGVAIAIGVIGIVPAGKLAAIAGKGVVGIFRAAVKWRKARRGSGVTKIAGKADTLKPGPFAKESIPAHRGRPTAAEQRKVNELFDKHGCHTCGTKNPGTKSGNAVADHQPAQALGNPKEFFPHCLNCARRQGGQVLQDILKRNQ